ncbi:hypothetical protein B0H16DRAFT_704995 [Mycena metata]|uniref:Aminoglycoside phosphotransferase domain-containing protein n=1 Tax=Mycena metata TaxID=1033252 RepID=A0AAD7GTQ6_9AGAR|nr:hypothetical protein B0H16DRAFT_704995 [Mycena metata]
MDKVPFTEEEIRIQCQLHQRVKRDFATRDPKANFVELQPKTATGSFAVKIAMNLARSSLEYDMAFMELLNRSTSERYRVPKAYGIFDDDQSSYLVMDCLEGRTMSKIIGSDEKQPLSDEDANNIAAVYQELRNDHRGLFQELIQSGSLTPLRHWWPQGYIFFRDFDGCRLVDDAHDFTDFMSTRFTKAGVDSNLVQLNEASVFIHGNAGPDNLMRCSDGKIGLLHFHMSFFGPPWWEFYASHQSPAPDRWVEPLKKAMARHGMGAPDSLVGELDEKFIYWFVRFGIACGMREEKERRKLVLVKKMQCRRLHSSNAAVRRGIESTQGA